MYDNQTDHCPCCGAEHSQLRPLPGLCLPCHEDRRPVPKCCRFCHEPHGPDRRREHQARAGWTRAQRLAQQARNTHKENQP